MPLVHPGNTPSLLHGILPMVPISFEANFFPKTENKLSALPESPGTYTKVRSPPQDPKNSLSKAGNYLSEPPWLRIVE